MPPRLSVVIITRNEAINIAACVASARFAEQVLVLDSGSDDDTVALARQAGAEVHQADWPGFGAQKNRALALADGEWLFSLDADERIPAALADEIRAAITAGAHDAYDLPRRSLFLSRFMRHAGWWPDRTCRLVRRGRGRFSDRAVHEQLIVDGTIGHLRHPLVHYSFRDVESVLDKMNRYSTAAAGEMAHGGRRASLAGAIGHGLWTFFRTYVLKLGVLDGAEGFLVAVSNAEGSYYKHLKRWQMDRGLPPPPA